MGALEKKTAEVAEVQETLHGVSLELTATRQDLVTTQETLDVSRQEIRKAHAETKLAECKTWDKKAAASKEVTALQDALSGMKGEVSVALAALCRSEDALRDRDIAIAHLRSALERLRGDLLPRIPTPNQGGGPSPMLAGSFASRQGESPTGRLTASLPTLPGVAGSLDVQDAAKRRAARDLMVKRRARWAPQWA